MHLPGEARARILILQNLAITRIAPCALSGIFLPDAGLAGVPVLGTFVSAYLPAKREFYRKLSNFRHLEASETADYRPITAILAEFPKANNKEIFPLEQGN